MAEDTHPQIGDIRIRFDPNPVYGGDICSVVLERYTDISFTSNESFTDWWMVHQESIEKPSRVARFFGDTLDRRVRRAFKRCRAYQRTKERTEAMKTKLAARYPPQAIKPADDGGQ